MNRLVCNVLALGLLCCVGCADDDLSPRYGESAGDGATAVNGLQVLADMFRRAGHDVSTTVTLSPRVHQNAEVIVWAPNDYQPPSDEARQWFQDWMADGLDRVLIYIGRDYDAVSEYWDAMLKTVPAQSPDAVDMQARAFAARRTQAVRRSHPSQPASPSTTRPAPSNSKPTLPPPPVWFTVQGPFNPHLASSLGGPWAEGIDASRAEVRLLTPLVPPSEHEPLLESLKETIAWREDTLDGQIIVVANGSFLLNMPLVNHEHRKLAGRLIDEIPAHAHVMFLESGPGGPSIRDDDDTGMRTGLEIFAVYPFNVILLHLAVVGVIFCFAKLPIFGVPRSGASGQGADFGAHIAALGNLLKRTRGADYARDRIAVYTMRTQTKPTSKTTSTTPAAATTHDE